jgi:hypothetical protein
MLYCVYMCVSIQHWFTRKKLKPVRSNHGWTNEACYLTYVNFWWILLILVTFLPAFTGAVTWPSFSSCFTGASQEFRKLTSTVARSSACWSINPFHLNCISGVWIQSVCWNKIGNVYTVYVACLACLLFYSPYYPWLFSVRTLSRHIVFRSATVSLVLLVLPYL